jgi:glycosyltransferase involved in cell wall biosynthesis
MTESGRIGAVLIGRNEGARLLACLASVGAQAGRMVYVDSGSTDGSVTAAQAAGAVVVDLDLSQPFTAARARNEGLARLLEDGPLDYVQFIDGDCELCDGWIGTAAAFLDAHPDIAVVHGRRRERFPEASLYNQLCDWEWDRPLGEAKACDLARCRLRPDLALPERAGLHAPHARQRRSAQTRAARALGHRRRRLHRRARPRSSPTATPDTPPAHDWIRVVESPTAATAPWAPA